MKTIKDSIYGILIVAGFLLICCDTNTAGQLLSIVLLGFGLLLLGGRGLILNNKEQS